MPARARMTRWYSVPRLASIGVRVAVSTVFGEFADRRDSLAAERVIGPAALDASYNYVDVQSGSDFWFDFVADNGDGWDSTYAVARMLAAPSLTIADCADGPLPRGRLIVMGGDQVYPTPSEEDYSTKLVEPFREASRSNAQSWPTPSPDLYAIPGNHDWYDGLSAFLNLFCWRQLPAAMATARQGGKIGGWQTQQTRSYFALALPHDWWLWGVDIQLTNYIDQQQINFFDHVARHWMAPGSRLILCAGVPDWVYVNPREPHGSFSHFSYVESLVTHAQRGHRLCLVLTGDSHHYSRYMEGDRHYITAGGGGAFLHPTHQLPSVNDFPWDWPAPGQVAIPPPPAPPGQKPPPRYRRTFTLAKSPHEEPRVFPSQARSRGLAWRNLAFAAFNWDFALAVGCICAIFAWILDANARFEGSSLPQALLKAGSFWPALCAYLKLVVASPWPTLLVLSAAAGYCYFADFRTGAERLLAGALHAFAQAAAVVAITITLPFWAPYAHTSVGLIIWVGVLGGVIAATIMGVYLLICLNVFGKHWNEAFSALRIVDYKNFLRLRIGADGALTIYPVGLTNVPRDRGTPPKNPALSPHLIEPPIHVR
jgi:hypothetical protein